jgi:hypothetical protein
MSEDHRIKRDTERWFGNRKKKQVLDINDIKPHTMGYSFHEILSPTTYITFPLTDHKV